MPFVPLFFEKGGEIKMQYCKNCGYCMDDNEKKCPRCGKKTGKSSTLSKFLTVIVILIAFTIFCPMCTGYNNAKNRNKNKSTSESSTLTAKKAGSDENSNSDFGETASEQEAPTNQEEQTTEGDFLAAASSVDYDLKITDWEISADYDNKPALVVYYEYTNKKDTPTAFMWEFTDKVYQNGIELSSTAFGVKEENNNQSKEIQQGVTATVSIAYILQDTENPVDITVEEYNIWTKGDYIINKTLDIKK